jgi:hypothetical protein
MLGREIVAIAAAHGWKDEGAGANHPHILKREGERPVPVRARLENRYEVQAILKQLSIPRRDRPDKVR